MSATARSAYPSPDNLATIPVWTVYVVAQASAAALGLLPKHALAAGVVINGNDVAFHFQLSRVDAQDERAMMEIRTECEAILGPSVDVSVSYEIREHRELSARVPRALWFWAARDASEQRSALPTASLGKDRAESESNHGLRHPRKSVNRGMVADPDHTFPTPADTGGIHAWTAWVVAQACQASLGLIPEHALAAGVAVAGRENRFHFLMSEVSGPDEDDMDDIVFELTALLGIDVTITYSYEVIEHGSSSGNTTTALWFWAA